MFCKFFVVLIIFWIKPTCFKMHLHSRQGQPGFHFLIIIVNDEREEQFFIFWGTIAHIFGLKKNTVSVPYLTVFGFLLYSSWWVLRLYVGGLWSFMMSPIIIAGGRLWRNLYISIAKLISMMDWKRAILFKKGIKWWFIIIINNS